MRTDRVVTRMNRDWEADKDEQWPSSHEGDCEQSDTQTPVKTSPSLAVGNESAE